MLFRILAVLCLLACTPALSSAAESIGRWQVTFALRIDNPEPRPFAISLSLPPTDTRQKISELDITERGLDAEYIEGPMPKVVFRGRQAGARRVAVDMLIERFAPDQTRPDLSPHDDPPEHVLPMLGPAPLFPSRSILVREFLETEVAPQLSGRRRDVLDAIWRTTRKKIEHQRDGKTLPLDILRRRVGRSIGIERVFTAFLRCAGFPARFVEGVRLASGTKKKRAFWTEVWSEEEWWAVSASRGWKKRRPPSYVKITENGDRILEIEGHASARYNVHAHKLPQPTAQPTEGRE